MVQVGGGVVYIRFPGPAADADEVYRPGVGAGDTAEDPQQAGVILLRGERSHMENEPGFRRQRAAREGGQALAGGGARGAVGCVSGNAQAVHLPGGDPEVGNDVVAAAVADAGDGVGRIEQAGVQAGVQAAAGPDRHDAGVAVHHRRAPAVEPPRQYGILQVIGGVGLYQVDALLPDEFGDPAQDTWPGNCAGPLIRQVRPFHARGDAQRGRRGPVQARDPQLMAAGREFFGELYGKGFGAAGLPAGNEEE